ncbi:hypothetical protein C5167_021474 [Papaver somniferum]|uniref:uncharacterized protein LOC113345943 n=1 Tax=Papaver somniferum TaxID=3469 RepID=UPI000E702BDD|nr:uncharacterized protein LOC113345943 [Papaver somniferum]RZC94230.1 hypothetical protein C5167_021474 [Papaver somniferum]
MASSSSSSVVMNMNKLLSYNCNTDSQAFSQKTQFHSPLNINQQHYSTRLSSEILSLKPNKPAGTILQKHLPRCTTTSATSPPTTDDVSDATKEVEESIKVLKKAAKTRKVEKQEVLAALGVIKKANKDIDPSKFLDTLGGTQSPGNTWMLIFTSKDKIKKGSYFPITAVQRFDAAGKRIENGVYLGPLGCLTFEGKFSWKKRILAFTFELLKIKIGPLPPLKINLGTQDDKEPSTKDPFFIWFYVDEEIAVAQGRGGGTAFWCRCRRVAA